MGSNFVSFIQNFPYKFNFHKNITIKFLFKINNYQNNKNYLFKFNFHENIKIKFLFEIIKSSKYLRIKIISLLLRISIRI